MVGIILDLSKGDGILNCRGFKRFGTAQGLFPTKDTDIIVGNDPRVVQIYRTQHIYITYSYNYIPNHIYDYCII